MEEKSFFNEGGVSVSNARFITGGQTYAMSGVTSVESVRHDPSRKAPIVVGVLGIVAMLFGGTGIVVGLFLLAGAVAMWFLQKPTFSVLLYTASGKSTALTRPDEKLISSVVAAINEAIVHRG